jgi:hypothetical protein
MPPAKKQKTGNKSSAPTQEPEPESTTPHKNAAEPEIRDVTTHKKVLHHIVLTEWKGNENPAL